MLSLNNVEVIYDGVILVLKGVSLEVREGGITTLLGANGAGKTTTLKAISGVLRTERGEVTKGSIELERPANRPAAALRGGATRRGPGVRGAARVRAPDHRGEPRGRRSHRIRPRARRHRDRARVSVLPAPQGAAIGPGRLSLGRRAADARHRARADVQSRASSCSTSRRSAWRPCWSRRSSQIVERLNREQKLTVLLVEQNATLALGIADHGYVMENGRLVLEGSGRGAPVERGHQGVLPRPHRGGRQEVLPRRQALQAPQALAVVTPSWRGSALSRSERLQDARGPEERLL